MHTRMGRFEIHEEGFSGHVGLERRREDYRRKGKIRWRRSRQTVEIQSMKVTRKKLKDRKGRDLIHGA